MKHEVDEDYIENVCGDLQCALINVFDNEGDTEEYDKANEMLIHIANMLDAMMPGED